MLTTFRYTLARFRSSILGWGLGVASLGVLLIPFYDVFLEQEEQFSALLANYPPELMAFFGGSLNFADPAEYVNTYLSFMPMLLGIFAILTGAGLIASDEESGRLDLILAHPISRTALFWGRTLAFLTATLLLLAVAWLGFAIPLFWSQMDVTAGAMALPFVSLLGISLVYGALALMISQLLASRRLAAAIASLVMIASYFLSSLASLDQTMKSLARFLPHDYYQGGKAIAGLNLTWVFGLVAVSACLALVGWWAFGRRDIRVGGEGGLELGRSLLQRREAKA